MYVTIIPTWQHLFDKIVHILIEATKMIYFFITIGGVLPHNVNKTSVALHKLEKGVRGTGQELIIYSMHIYMIIEQHPGTVS